MDFKAFAYGLGAFVAGHLLVGMVTTAALSPDSISLDGPAWALAHLGSYVVPIIAGYVAAYHASHRRVFHGIGSGAAGAALILVPSVFVPGYPFFGIPFVVATYARLAWLGALGGNFHRNKVGS